MTRRLGQPNISRDYALEDLIPEETAKIGGDLLRECRPVVIHGQENAFDLEVSIDRPADAHMRIKKLRNALDGEILALNRDED